MTATQYATQENFELAEFGFKDTLKYLEENYPEKIDI